MRPLPYTDTGAGVAFYALLVALMAGELRVRVRSAVHREGSHVDRGSYWFVYVTVAGGLIGGFLLASRVHGAAISFARWPIFVVGALLMAVGIGLRQWSIALLGRFFTVDVRVHEDQVVIDTGPYRWLRHPSYSALIVIFLGIGLALGNWLAVVALLGLPTAGLIVRIRVEERALLEGLGEPYRRFAASRARLIPGVW